MVKVLCANALSFSRDEMSRARNERLKGQPPPILPDLPGRQYSRNYGKRGPKPKFPLPDEEWGPEMAALMHDGLRAAVIAKVWYNKSEPEACRWAGYLDESPHALEVKASRIFRMEKVQAAVIAEGRKLVRIGAVPAAHYAIGLINNEEAKHDTRLKAAIAIMDRAGLHAINESHTHVHEHKTTEEKDQRIAELLSILGISPDEVRKALVQPKVELKRGDDGVYEEKKDEG